MTLQPTRRLGLTECMWMCVLDRDSASTSTGGVLLNAAHACAAGTVISIEKDWLWALTAARFLWQSSSGSKNAELRQQGLLPIGQRVKVPPAPRPCYVLCSAVLCSAAPCRRQLHAPLRRGGCAARAFDLFRCHTCGPHSSRSQGRQSWWAEPRGGGCARPAAGGGEWSRCASGVMHVLMARRQRCAG